MLPGLRKGYICLESEGAEIEFRNFKLTELAYGVIGRAGGGAAALIALAGNNEKRIARVEDLQSEPVKG